MAVTSKHPILRWAVPALAVAAVGVASVAPRAVADPALPPRTAEQLLVDLQAAEVDTFSGTVETRSDLGLPALPLGDSDFSALTTGTHILRVWHDGEDKSRVSLIGDGAEASVIRNGNDLWQWSSNSRTAQHAVVPEGHGEQAPQDYPPRTPQEAAQQFLAHIEPTTTVTVSQTAKVADRAAYELVLDPKSEDTLIAKIVIAVDAETHAPLRVEVFATGAEEPAVSVGFTRVDFSAPDASVFAFTPPAGVTVEQLDPSDKPVPSGERDNHPKPAVTTVGEGWDRVLVTAVPQRPEQPQAPADTQQGQELHQVLEQLPTVSGPWGSGRVLTSALVTVVFTDDGQVAVGMVPTDRVLAALPQ